MKSKLKISDKLYASLLDARTRLGAKSTLGVLAETPEGICVRVFPLNRHFGCKWMPGISGVTLSKVYIRMSKKKLHFGGFVHLSIVNQRRVGWNWLFGDRMHPPGTKILTVGPESVRCRVYQNGMYENVRIQIIKSVTPKKKVTK